MTCEQCRNQLNMLADGALSPVQKLRVRHHMAQCQGCAQTFTEIVRLGTEAHQWRNAVPPDTLAVRIATALPTQTDRTKEDAMILERPLSGPKRPAPRFVFAAVLCLAALAVLAFWPGSPGRPAVALADVERAVQQVNIVSYTESHTSYLGNDTPLNTDVSQSWMRGTPSATASVPLPALSWPQNLARLNISRQFLYDGRGAFIHNIAGTQASMNIDYILDAGARLTPDKMREMLDNLLHGGHAVPEGFTLVSPARSKTVQWEGRSVLRIVRQVSYRNMPEDTLSTETYWVDPATLRPLRIEIRAVTARTRKPYYTDVLTDFRYDVQPPAGVFDWSPPKGARVDVIYRTPAGLYKTDKLFPSWPGGASIPPLHAK